MAFERQYRSRIPINDVNMAELIWTAGAQAKETPSFILWQISHYRGIENKLNQVCRNKQFNCSQIFGHSYDLSPN